MTVVQLPTRTTSQWSVADRALSAALQVAGHPRLSEHAEMAERFQLEFGIPTQVWANRMAAIAVIAERRADAAPTMQRRSAYLDVAAAASALLLLADEVHGVQPVHEALELLSPTADRSVALI